MLEKISDSDLTLDTGTTVIRPVKSVRDLSVHLDSELTMKTHILKVVCSSYHQLSKIRHVRRLVGQDSWFQHTCYRYSTTVTHCCLVCHGQLFSLCSV